MTTTGLHTASIRAWKGAFRATLLLLIAILLLAPTGLLDRISPVSSTAMSPWRGNGFIFSLKSKKWWERFFYTTASDFEGLGRSVLILRENGKPLASPHANHNDIETLGRGRYSHWGEDVGFAASDNTDPRSNSRHYDVLEPVSFLRMLSILGILLAGLAVWRRFIIRLPFRNVEEIAMLARRVRRTHGFVRRSWRYVPNFVPKISLRHIPSLRSRRQFTSLRLTRTKGSRPITARLPTIATFSARAMFSLAFVESIRKSGG